MRVFFFLSAFLLGFLFSFFVNPQSSYADDIQPWSYTMTSNTFKPYLCGASSSNEYLNTTPCSSYKYFTVTYSDSTNITTDTYFRFYASDYSYNSNYVIPQKFYLVSDFSSVYIHSMTNNHGASLTFTIYPTFPDDESCPVCPDVPDNPYDTKFDKLIVAVYTCGAIMLVIYFFYCIYRMIIKSTGGF